MGKVIEITEQTIYSGFLCTFDIYFKVITDHQAFTGFGIGFFQGKLKNLFFRFFRSGFLRGSDGSKIFIQIVGFDLYFLNLLKSVCDYMKNVFSSEGIQELLQR